MKHYTFGLNEILTIPDGLDVFVYKGVLYERIQEKWFPVRSWP